MHAKQREAQRSPSYGASCPENVVMKNEAIINIPSNILVAAKSYQFSVFVMNQYNTTSTANTIIDIVKANIPISKIIPVVSKININYSKISQKLKTMKLNLESKSADSADRNLIQELILQNNQYIYNKVKYQDRDGYVNTCGSHAVHKLYRLKARRHGPVHILQLHEA